MICRKVVKGPHLGISPPIAITMALCLAYAVRAIPKKTLSSLNGIDDKKSYRSGVHDGRGQTAVERALDLDLLPRSTGKRLNVSFLLLIQPYNGV